MVDTDRVALIRERLTVALSPQDLEIIDESHKHARHEGARDGGGHFSIRVVSQAFRGKNLLERHRMVYAAMGDAMHREIHALSIKAQAPGEP